MKVINMLINLVNNVTDLHSQVTISIVMVGINLSTPMKANSFPSTTALGFEISASPSRLAHHRLVSIPRQGTLIRHHLLHTLKLIRTKIVNNNNLHPVALGSILVTSTVATTTETTATPTPTKPVTLKRRKPTTSKVITSLWIGRKYHLTRKPTTTTRCLTFAKLFLPLI